MKPRFTADEAVLIIKAARGKNCAMKKMRRKKKMAAIHKVARLYAARAPMEKKAFPVGAILTALSFAPEILKGLKWAGRGVGLLGKAKGLASGARALTGTQQLGSGIYRGLGGAAKWLGGQLGRAGGQGWLGEAARGAGKSMAGWGGRMGAAAEAAAPVFRDPKYFKTLAAMGHAVPATRGIELAGQIGRGAPLALMGLGGLMGTGGGQLQQMPPQMALGGGGGGYGQPNIPPEIMAQIMGGGGY
jgi:hypothetical protein